MGIDCISTKNIIFAPTKPLFCFKTLDQHQDKVVSLIELSSGKIATGSYDKTIKIWNIKKFECEMTLNEEGNVFCLLEFEPNLLLSGTDKNTIQLWDINNNKNNYLKKFEGHTLWVNGLVKCNDKYFASCSNDEDIRIWNFTTLKCENILKGHSDCVLCLINLMDGKLCSGSSDCSIKIWDWEKNICELTLEDNKDWIKCLYQLKNGYILSGLNDGTIKIWEKDKNTYNLFGHLGSIRGFCQINGQYFASSSFDKTIKIWDINNMKCINTLKGHKSNVIGIIFINNYLISCSNDKTIKFWKNSNTVYESQNN